jgi:hypothetical protein
MESSRLVPSASRHFAIVLIHAVALALCGCGESPEAIAHEKREADRLAQLSALGYTGFVEGEHKSKLGVVRSDPSKSFDGVNVFGSRGNDEFAYLFDMKGNELHRWLALPTDGRSLLWMEPAADRNLIVSGRRYLLKMDAAGEVLWEAPPRTYHHGFDQDSAGRIYAMAQERRVVDLGGRELPIIDDLIVVLNPDGSLLHQFSIFDLIGAERIPEVLAGFIARRERKEDIDPAQFIVHGVDNPYDVYHLNSVEVLERDIGVARKGDLLLCLRTLDLVFVVDPKGERIVWQWTAGQDELDRPHYPTQLQNGNLLIFDNGWHTGHSRIVELDPRSEEIVWTYEPGPEFFSRRGGMAQPLPNGNLLLTQQDAGRVFEITREGEVVWDFWNPQHHRASGLRLSIYRAWRWSAEDLEKVALPDELRASLTSGLSSH